MGNSSSYALDYGHSWETREVHHDAVNRSTWEVFGDAGEDETVVACVCAEQAMAERIAELLNGHARLVADVAQAVRLRTESAAEAWNRLPAIGVRKRSRVAMQQPASSWAALASFTNTSGLGCVLFSPTDAVELLIGPGVPIVDHDNGVVVAGKYLVHLPLFVREATPEDVASDEWRHASE